jgi:hypothetical protein
VKGIPRDEYALKMMKRTGDELLEEKADAFSPRT